MTARLLRFLPDSFVLIMLCAVALGFLWPEGGLPEGPLRLTLVTQIGIALVFFLHGANLVPAAMLSGLKQWRVHALAQGSTFVFFPILCLGIYAATPWLLPEPLRIGIFFLGVVPSTIASSVAMTALGRGSVPAAIFNASLSSIVGMIVTPILMVWLGAKFIDFSFADAVGSIAVQLLLPFALGQLSRPFTASFVAKRKAWIGKIDRAVIAIIVYGSFARAAHDDIWSQFSVLDIVLLLALVASILLVALTATRAAARAVGLSREEEVAAVFCGSQKSLASGAPMAQVMFAGNPALGLIVLPLMAYHQLQLTACAILARRYAIAAEDAAHATAPAPVSNDWSEQQR